MMATELKPAAVVFGSFRRERTAKAMRDLGEQRLGTTTKRFGRRPMGH